MPSILRIEPAMQFLAGLIIKDREVFVRHRDLLVGLRSQQPCDDFGLEHFWSCGEGSADPDSG